MGSRVLRLRLGYAVCRLLLDCLDQEVSHACAKGERRRWVPQAQRPRRKGGATERKTWVLTDLTRRGSKPAARFDGIFHKKGDDCMFPPKQAFTTATFGY